MNIVAYTALLTTILVVPFSSFGTTEKGFQSKLDETLDGLNDTCTPKTDVALFMQDIEKLNRSVEFSRKRENTDANLEVLFTEPQIDKINSLLKNCLMNSKTIEQRKIYQFLDNVLYSSINGMHNLVTNIDEIMINAGDDKRYQEYFDFLEHFELGSFYFDYLIIKSKVQLKECMRESIVETEINSCFNTSMEVLTGGAKRIAEALEGTRLEYSTSTLVPFYFRSIDDLMYLIIMWKILPLNQNNLNKYLSTAEGVKLVNLNGIEEILSSFNIDAEFQPGLEHYIDQVYIGDFINFCGKIKENSGGYGIYPGYIGDFILYDRLVRILIEKQLSIVDSKDFNDWLLSGTYLELCQIYEKYNLFSVDFRADLQLVYKLSADPSDKNLISSARSIASNYIKTSLNIPLELVVVRDPYAGRKNGYKLLVGQPLDDKGLTDSNYAELKNLLEEKDDDAVVYFERPNVIW